MRLLADLSVFKLQPPWRDLRCNVEVAKPELGFDFLFHTGYQVEVPIRELAGGANELTILFRVIPLDRLNDPSYIMQTVPVPALEEGKGGGKFYGVFTVGEGRYHIDWLMRDQRERACSRSWDLEVKLNSKDSQLREWIPQALVDLRKPLFAAEPPMTRGPESPALRLSIIVNFDPSDPFAALIDDPGLYGLVAILRRMGRDPRIEPYSLLICSLENQQVVYERESQNGIDLPALGEALRSLKLGTVDAKRLASSKGPAQFASDLIRAELRKESTEAMVMLGPKGGSQIPVSREALESFDKSGKPAFYLSYYTGQNLRPTRDPISSIMKHLRGLEYSINRPKDFFNAWSDIVTRLVRTKPGLQASTAGTAATK